MKKLLRKLETKCTRNGSFLSDILSLEINIENIKLRNPFILASGILDVTPSLFFRVASSGAGAIVTKTVTLEERKGFDNPVITDAPCGLINSMGLPNPGIKYFVNKYVKSIIDKIDIPIILSIGPSSVKDVYEMSNIVLDSGLKWIEINASCPHVKGHGLTVLGDESMLGEIIRVTKKKLSNFLIFVKISAHITNLAKIAETIFSSGADGIVAINTLRAIAIDIWSKKPILGGIFGGLSGPAIKPVALRCVYELYQYFPEKVIIGVGGISSWRDAIEFFLAGASAIQIGSVIAFKDLNIFKELNDGVIKYLNKEGYDSINEIIGLAHRF